MGLFKGQTDLDRWDKNQSNLDDFEEKNSRKYSKKNRKSKNHECEPVEMISPRLGDDVEVPQWYCKHCYKYMGEGW